MRVANNIAVLGIALFAAAVANAEQSGSVNSYSSIDANSDGKISRAEAQANSDLKKQWSQLDVNADGRLSKGEFARFEAEAGSQNRLGPERGIDSRSRTNSGAEINPRDGIGSEGGIQTSPQNDALDMK